MTIRPGVLLGRDDYDWQAGGNSAIERSVLVSTLDWKPYLGEHEIQFIGSGTLEAYDSLFCVTFSYLSPMVALFMYHLSNDLISEENVVWLQDNGYFKNGFINFNERFTATLGGTNEQGAYQFSIANAGKNYGLIPQDMFPMADNFYDNVDEKFITDEMYDLGKEFLKRFELNYEWVDSIENALQYSPVQTIVRFANYDDPEDILKPDGATNHAVTGVYTVTDYDEVRDSYWQILKRYGKDYTHSLMAFKLTINNNTMDTSKFVIDNDKKWVQNSNTGQFGRVLQGKLFAFISEDRGALALLDDKMRTEPSIKITQAEWQELDNDELLINF